MNKQKVWLWIAGVVVVVLLATITTQIRPTTDIPVQAINREQHEQEHQGKR